MNAPLSENAFNLYCAHLVQVVTKQRVALHCYQILDSRLIHFFLENPLPLIADEMEIQVVQKFLN